ncbi:uncharacterized protein LOC123006270 isoform X2 [Tribolium madens]|uniref:uncharacterized protein LOC123006270 isoform X2 n=1 Tax=Tribolium madens TaxID=41895 RepID=UPI001CF73A3D|nr:uncharacterized protein LOC123006270 isoform X2 [Tribolium madens]
MGSCFGKCLPKSDTSKSLRNFNILQGQRNGVEFAFLVDDSSTTQHIKRSFFSRLFNKRNDNKQPVLNLVDGLLNPQLTAYSRLNESQRLPSTGSCTSRDIQLQCLDARALLSRTAASTPVSSLDLEWEHETIPISMIHDPSGSSWTALPEDFSETSPQNTAPGLNSDSDWSRVSSANSLEWDNVQNSIQASPPISEIDTDTQILLSEIERLTSKTLRETGHDLFS